MKMMMTCETCLKHYLNCEQCDFGQQKEFCIYRLLEKELNQKKEVKVSN